MTGNLRMLTAIETHTIQQDCRQTGRRWQDVVKETYRAMWERQQGEPTLKCCGSILAPGLGKYGCPNCEGENVAVVVPAPAGRRSSG